MAYEDDLVDLQGRILTALRTRSPRVMRWYRAEATGIERHIRATLDDPRSAAARLPGRITCRLLRRHNWTCIGQPRHPARW
jgi:hypothetical protein